MANITEIIIKHLKGENNVTLKDATGLKVTSKSLNSDNKSLFKTLVRATTELGGKILGGALIATALFGSPTSANAATNLTLKPNTTPTEFLKAVENMNPNDKLLNHITNLVEAKMEQLKKYDLDITVSGNNKGMYLNVNGKPIAHFKDFANLEKRITPVLNHILRKYEFREAAYNYKMALKEYMISPNALSKKKVVNSLVALGEIEIQKDKDKLSENQINQLKTELPKQAIVAISRYSSNIGNINGTWGKNNITKSELEEKYKEIGHRFFNSVKETIKNTIEVGIKEICLD